MMRRTFMHAALAAPIAGFIHGQVFAPAVAEETAETPVAIPALVKAEGTDTPILRLFREYNRISEEARAFFVAGTGVSGRDEDELLDRLFYNRRDKIEDEMMALPCTCAADFAAKVIVDTCQGDAISDWETGILWIEARALTEWRRD